MNNKKILIYGAGHVSASLGVLLSKKYISQTIIDKKLKIVGI